MQDLSNIVYFKGGVTGALHTFGRSGSYNCVVRGEFTTGSGGATSIYIETTNQAIRKVSGEDITKIPFCITTDSMAYANANLSEGGYKQTGYINGLGDYGYHMSGSANVVLQANTTYYLWFYPLNNYSYAYWYDGIMFELSGSSSYTLDISGDAGSNIVVNRTSSKAIGASIGALSDNDFIYSNDVLKITIEALPNYVLLTSDVNGVSFTSGSSHTVVGNVAVSATTKALVSTIGATSGNIGSVSTITVTKFDQSYYHSIRYDFGSVSGYVTSTGGSSNTEVLFQNASIAFTIPTSFYAEIPNAKTGTCTLTCTTYETSAGGTPLGSATTCTFTATATGSPVVSGAVIDINPTTIALTGDSGILVRYQSYAQATITATAMNSSTIVSTTINGDTTISGTIVYNNTGVNRYVFTAVDSRGYSSSAIVTLPMVAYVQLTLNPTITRTTPTGGEVTLSFGGDIYRGSFGDATNTITVKYRYKDSTSLYSEWYSVSASSIVFSGNTYASASDIVLGSSFDYRKDYTFQVQAVDGTSSAVLSTVTKTVSITRGVPIFDWGEEDFNFNVPVTINNVPLDDMYLSSSDVDATPTQGSDNPVSSGGTYTALGGKINEPSSDGNNGDALITNGSGTRQWAEIIPGKVKIGNDVYQLRIDTTGTAGYITFVL